VFETSVSHFYDACVFARDGLCNVKYSDIESNTLTCPPNSDWEDCGLPPPPDAGPFGKLINVRSLEAEMVVRGSTVMNLTLKSVRLVGAVNSTFEPPLPPSQAVQPRSGSGACGVHLAGQWLCDPRAKCEGAPSGGVRCSCTDAGLDFRPGFAADGQKCMQQTSINLLTQTSHVIMSVKKPTFNAGAVLIVFSAAGETGFNASYSMSVARVRPSDAVPQLRGPNSTQRSWSSIDHQRMSLDGHHLIWKGTPPSADSAVDLGDVAGKFSFTKAFTLSIELNCTTGEPCIEDGDVIHTFVTATSDSDGLVSEVKISSAVESLASCNNSVAVVMQSDGSSEGESGVPVADLLATDVAFVFVDLRVVDADGIPIRVNQPKSVVSWGSGDGPARQIVPTKAIERNSWSNRFTAVLEDSWRSSPGSYVLQVELRGAWNENLGVVGDCVLLKHTIRIEKPEGVNTVWLSVGSLSACAVFVGAIVFWARRMPAELRNVLVMVLTEASKSVISISFELGDLITDLLTTYLVIFEGIVRSPQYRVPYAVFGCLSIMMGLVSIVHHLRRAAALRTQLKTNAAVQHGPGAEGESLQVEEASLPVVQKLEWESEKAPRDLKGLAVTVLCLLLEDLPMVRAMQNVLMCVPQTVLLSCLDGRRCCPRSSS
jgi:hypothetical protein